MSGVYSALIFLALGALAVVAYPILLLIFAAGSEDSSIFYPTAEAFEKAQRQESRKSKGIALALAVGVLLVVAVITAAILRYQNADAALTPRITAFVVGVVYFTVMLLGMAGEYMFGLKSWGSFSIMEFQRPLWVSLLVFGGIWSALDKGQLSFTSLLACYQNGFFWKTVLRHPTSRPRKAKAKAGPRG